MRICLGSSREGVESHPRRANVAGVGPSSLGSRETSRLPVRIHGEGALGERSISTPVVHPPEFSIRNGPGSHRIKKSSPGHFQITGLHSWPEPVSLHMLWPECNRGKQLPDA